MPVSLQKWALTAAVIGVISLTSADLASAEPVTPHATPAVGNRPPLLDTPLRPLPIGQVRADGWLLRQLRLQKSGLTGSAETLYDALTPDSAWLGGKGEAWEKGPYYVRGLIALAYTLDDAELKSRAEKWINWALQSQRPDGFFGPASNDDWWPRMVVLYYLRDYHEATGDERVLPFLTQYFRYQLEHLPKRPLVDWGRSRAGDNIDVVLWTYNRTHEPFLLDLARLLQKQAYPWASIYRDNRFYDFGADFQPHHIVNVSQALKFPALSYQLSKDPADATPHAAGVEQTDRLYGRIDGQISGSEMLSGRRSTDGVELCADIERILSDGISVTTFGDATIGDRIEKIAYNSLPAHTSPTMRQITYYQLPNQVGATIGSNGFQQDYHNGNVPGPHSGFPCCCYNWHAGWPKFVQQMWAATNDGGVAAVAYGPNRLQTTVASDVPLTVRQTTDYPFAERITLVIEPKRPARFPVLLRLPAWCDAPQVKVNGEAQTGLKAGTFHRVEREWKAGDVVELNFPMAVRLSRWVNGSAGVERGPLAFALRIKEEWKSIKKYPPHFDEFEVRPASPWNYAIALNDPKSITSTTAAVPAVPFDNAAPPVVLHASAKRLPGWGLRSQPGSVVLGKSEFGWKQLADTRVPLEPGVPHRLRVSMKGKLIEIFLNDMQRPLIAHEDDTIKSGGVGLRTYGTEATFANVRLDGNSLDSQRIAASAGNDGKMLYTLPPKQDDFVYEADVTVRPGGDAGLILRGNDIKPALDGYRGYYVGLGAHGEKSDDAAEPPVSPVTSSEPTESIELIPFGSSKLRVSYLPVLRKE